MSSHSNFSRLGAHDSSSPASYCATVRKAHELADLLKRTRPHLYEQVTQLQATVTRCQQTLDASKTQLQQATTLAQHEGRAPNPAVSHSNEYDNALQELEAATQALLDLRHKGQMAR